ncbi:MAG: hypothetical protein ABI655_00180, partial [Phenylobacterium sp.]
MSQIDATDPGAAPLREDPPLDRAISPIAGRLGSGRAGRAIVLGALLAGCAVFALATWRADRPMPDKAPVQPARQVVAFEPAKAAAPTLGQPGPGAPSLSSPQDGATGTVPALAADSAAPPAGSAQAQVQAARAAELRAVRGAPILAWSRSGGAAALGPSLVPALAGGAEQVPTELDQLRG